MKPTSPTLRWLWAALALFLVAVGLALFVLPDDASQRQAIADLQQQNDARRQELAARHRQPFERAASSESPAEENQPGQVAAPSRTVTSTGDLIRRIDRLSASLSSLERAALNLDRRISQSKLDVAEDSAPQEMVVEMESELEAKHQQCLELVAQARKIAQQANVELEDDFFTENRPIPPGLTKNQAFVTACTRAKQDHNLFNLLLARFAEAKLGIPPKR